MDSDPQGGGLCLDSQTTMVLQQTRVKDCVRTKVKENDCLYTWLTDNKKRPHVPGTGSKGVGTRAVGS